MIIRVELNIKCKHLSLNDMENINVNGRCMLKRSKSVGDMDRITNDENININDNANGCDNTPRKKTLTTQDINENKWIIVIRIITDIYC